MNKIIYIVLLVLYILFIYMQTHPQTNTQFLTKRNGNFMLGILEYTQMLIHSNTDEFSKRS